MTEQDRFERESHDERQIRSQPKFKDRSYASKKFRDYRSSKNAGNGEEHFVAPEYRQAPSRGNGNEETPPAAGDAGVARYPEGSTIKGLHGDDEEYRYRRPDSSIFAAISTRLSDDATIDASDVRISVNEGIVSLQGDVDSEYSKNVVTEIASDVSGVRRVEYNLLETDDKEYSDGSQHSGSTGLKRSLLEKS